MYFVYALRSEKTSCLYIGTTNDLERRVREHNAGRSRATRLYGPWSVVHVKEHATLAAARKREWYLKHAPGAEREKRDWLAGP